MSTDDIDKARTEFWHKMTDLVREYDLYTFDPNIKEMERDLMIAYDQSRSTLKAELLAKIPKEKQTEADKLRSQGYRVVGSSPFVDAENDGYNQAIREITKIIEDM